MKICIISPHLDDAILSCGIMMQRAVAKGDALFVYNIFTKGHNSENRKNEEHAAMAYFGAKVFFADELDAPDRDARYQSDIALFWGDLKDVPESFISHLASRLRHFITEHEIERVYLPLGAGGHIDHRLCFEAAKELRDMTAEFYFYEDRPYILWPGVLQGRLNQLGIQHDLPPVTAQDMQESLGDYSYLSYFVPAGEFQKTCLPYYFEALEKKNNHLAAETVTLEASKGEAEKLYQALAAYTSQIPFIYKDYNVFIADSLRHEAKRTGKDVYLERTWRIFV
jgi:LmbE family N-acetylglucosaminyl deacetylase